MAIVSVTAALWSTSSYTIAIIEAANGIHEVGKAAGSSSSTSCA
jgi:hypothetical protein